MKPILPQLNNPDYWNVPARKPDLKAPENRPLKPAPLYYFRLACGRVFPAQSVAEFLKAQIVLVSDVPTIMACAVGTTQWIPLAGLCLPPSPPKPAEPDPVIPSSPLSAAQVALWLLLAASLIGGVCTLAMDTTVETRIGSVHNLDLAQHQLLYAIFSGLGFTTAVLGLCLSRNSKTDAIPAIINPSLQSRSPQSVNAGTC